MMLKLQNRVFYRWLAMGLFVMGLIWGLLFWGVLLAGHLEASRFETTPLGETGLDTLRCPLLLTTGETNEITAVLENPSDRERRRTAYTFVTDGSILLAREETFRTTLAPGQSEQIVLPIHASDAAWDWMILARVVVLRNNPLPGQTAACGIPVLPVPLVTGGQLTAVSLFTIVVGLVGGTAIWKMIEKSDHGRGPETDRGMIGMTITLLLGLTITIWGWWFPGIALFIITFLMALSWVLKTEEVQHF